MLTPDGRIVCDDCHQELAVGQFPFCNGHGEGHGYVIPGFAAVHPKERTVVYQHPLTGAVRYPGRADVPMPQRYADQGYQRVEFDSVHKLSKFEKQNNVVNDAVWYNSGNTHCSENTRED